MNETKPSSGQKGEEHANKHIRSYASVVKLNESGENVEKETQISEEKSKDESEVRESPATLMGVITEVGKDIALITLVCTDYAVQLVKEGTDYASQKVHEATESLTHRIEESGRLHEEKPKSVEIDAEKMAAATKRET